MYSQSSGMYFRQCNFVLPSRPFWISRPTKRACICRRTKNASNGPILTGFFFFISVSISNRHAKLEVSNFRVFAAPERFGRLFLMEVLQLQNAIMSDYSCVISFLWCRSICLRPIKNMDTSLFLFRNLQKDMTEIQWNLSVTTTFLIKFITCDSFSNVF